MKIRRPLAGMTPSVMLFQECAAHLRRIVRGA
jgi:hypothetical protein